MSAYLQEWNVAVIDGTIDDFLTACADLASSTHVPSPSDDSRTLMVADMARDPEGDLISEPGKLLPVQIPDVD